MNAHWIDKDWTLRKVLLAFHEFSGSHSAENTAEQLWLPLKEYEIYGNMSMQIGVLYRSPLRLYSSVGLRPMAWLQMTRRSVSSQPRSSHPTMNLMPKSDACGMTVRES
jgi:hypothetical protein